MMTEQEFDRKVEAMADQLGKKIEDTADRFDRAVTRKWERGRWFRRVARTVSFTAEAGLIAGACFLFRSGYRVWGAICFWLGIIALLFDLFRLLFLRRRP
ncbi:MAG: hypothetical protein KH056_03325 [Clostridiales bacterium]|nr:hypothetical protein [Clostridiales bacterium]